MDYHFVIYSGVATCTTLSTENNKFYSIVTLVGIFKTCSELLILILWVSVRYPNGGYSICEYFCSQ